MKKGILLSIGFVLISIACWSQDIFDYDDKIYDQDIGTVNFRIKGQLTRYPILPLNGSIPLDLSFDDFNDEVRDLYYKVVLCNSDWTPTDLEETDYITGFNNNEIEDIEFSFNTRANFINYRVEFPNDDLKITKSGNYLIYVYDYDTELPVLSRRFLILEEKFIIQASVVAPSMVEYRNTHHEIDFEVLKQGIKVNNAETQLKVRLMQNWRWDNSITNIKPRFSRTNVENYDYNNKILFEAGNEHRWIDLRSIDFRSEGMAHINIYDDGYGIIMLRDTIRGNKVYRDYEDLNGDYIVQNTDDPNLRDTFQFTSTSLDQSEEDEINIANLTLQNDRIKTNQLKSDYSDVHLTLAASLPLYNQDIYAVGNFCNWKLLEKNRMIYREDQNAYTGVIELKQGYYDYVYAAVEKGSNKIALGETEGNHYETKNEYTILVYFRGITDRHDRLLGYRSIFSTGE